MPTQTVKYRSSLSLKSSTESPGTEEVTKCWISNEYETVKCYLLFLQWLYDERRRPIDTQQNTFDTRASHVHLEVSRLLYGCSVFVVQKNERKWSGVTSKVAVEVASVSPLTRCIFLVFVRINKMDSKEVDLKSNQESLIRVDDDCEPTGSKSEVSFQSNTQPTSVRESSAEGSKMKATQRMHSRGKLFNAFCDTWDRDVKLKRTNMNEAVVGANNISELSILL